MRGEALRGWGVGGADRSGREQVRSRGLGSAGVRVDAGGPGGTSSSSMAGAWPAVIPHRDEAVFPLPQVGLSFFSW